MDSASPRLPPALDLSPSILSFLNSKLRTNEHLTRAPNLVSELRSQCGDLDRTLIELNRSLGSSLLAYAAVSDRAHGVLGHVTDQLSALESSTRSGSSDGEGRVEQILGEELPALAKEVARVESVRTYAETALKLQTMIGDIEDAVSSTMKKNSWKHSLKQNAEELRLVAIRTLKLTEDVLNSVTKSHPQWAHLVSAVDHRVDRALAILRPQAIADHRALLSSLGWPPPLSSTPDSGKSNHVHSLFSMEGDLKDQYCENFIALCSLQELQRRRKSRQLEGYNRELALHQPLWVIEELVNPISLASQRHFEKWIDKPELIFELVYKVTRDYVDSMNELLQPLVGKATLTGYDCTEEWISGMVSSLSTYLAKEIFPKFAQTGEDGVMSTQEQARISWLHLVDLMISFDKRIKTLIIEHTGIGRSMKTLLEDTGVVPSLEHSCKSSSLNIFCDRPDWLDLWAAMELNDILEKLKLETWDERNWTMKVRGASLLFDAEDYKAPAISNVYLRSLSSVVDRCRALPRFSMRSRFLNLTGEPIIHKFLDCLLFRCQEAEGLTALTDNDALVKVANSINAARYFESVLKDWCDNVLDRLGSSRSDQPISVDEPDGNLDSVECIKFDREIVKLEEFRVEWAGKLCVVILRGFDAECRDYVKNRRQWQEKGEDGWALSRCLVGALDYLQGKTTVVEVHLNQVDFRGVWRSLAGGIDRMFFSGILMNNVKFHDGGVERFGSDVEVLYGTFRGWCMRPEVLFPKVSEGLKLLRMGAEQLQNSLAEEEWMKENKIKHMSVAEAEKIVKSRVFTS